MELQHFSVTVWFESHGRGNVNDNPSPHGRETFAQLKLPRPISSRPLFSSVPRLSRRNAVNTLHDTCMNLLLVILRKIWVSRSRCFQTGNRHFQILFELSFIFEKTIFVGKLTNRYIYYIYMSNIRYIKFLSDLICLYPRRGPAPKQNNPL